MWLLKVFCFYFAPLGRISQGSMLEKKYKLSESTFTFYEKPPNPKIEEVE